MMMISFIYLFMFSSVIICETLILKYIKGSFLDIILISI